MLLSNKNAIITGCSRGIGKSILECFAENGANIWACFRNDTEENIKLCTDISKKYNVQITPVFFDITNYEEVRDKVKEIYKSKNRIDILVNNAGVTDNTLFSMLSINSIRNTFEANFFSQMVLIQYVSKFMIRQKQGNIINMSSIIGIDGNAGQVAYSASKAAIIGATKSLAKELVGYNIRVNAIAPGFTQTDMLENIPKNIYNKCVETVGMKRPATPDEIAKTVVYLASDMSTYVTGQVIRVDGGV